MLQSHNSSNPWSLSGLVLDWITNFIQTKNINTVIECGSGQSTLHFAQLQAQGTIQKYLSLEHDFYWFHQTRSLLQSANLSLDHLHHCPLVSYPLKQNWQWYDRSNLSSFEADLILIDGLPGNSSPLARYPAPHLLQKFIKPGTWLLLDDSHRPDEQTILEHWQQELPLQVYQTIRLAQTHLSLLRVAESPHLQEYSPSKQSQPETPKISIVTTIYNREKYLPQTIESILSQSFSDFELILWDDGSTDASLQIAHHYAAQDDRINVIAAKHQGRGKAVAQACALAQGQYIGLVDSDDLLAHTALAETAKFLDDNPNTGLVYTDYLLIAEDNSIKGYGNHCQSPYDKDRLLLEFMVFHFRLMRNSVYKNVGGFDPSFTYAQDYDLCLRLSETIEIKQIKRPLYYYRHHSQSISGDKRIDQMLYSKQAMENALQRRGMTDDYELEFQIFAQCSLVKKNTKKID